MNDLEHEYPSVDLLNQLRTFDFKDVFRMLSVIKDNWVFNKYEEQWIVKDDLPVLRVKLSTAGYSGNELIIDAPFAGARLLTRDGTNASDSNIVYYH